MLPILSFFGSLFGFGSGFGGLLLGLFDLLFSPFVDLGNFLLCLFNTFLFFGLRQFKSLLCFLLVLQDLGTRGSLLLFNSDHGLGLSFLLLGFFNELICSFDLIGGFWLFNGYLILSLSDSFGGLFFNFSKFLLFINSQLFFNIFICFFNLSLWSNLCVL